MNSKLVLVFFLLIYSVRLSAQTDEFEPVQCRYSVGGLEKRVSCSRLKSVGSKTKSVLGNACLFKSGQWQFGELKPDPKLSSTYKFKFKSKFVCSLGVVAINRNSQPQGFLGPARYMAFSNASTPKVVATKDGKNLKEVVIAGYNKKYVAFSSKAYFGEPSANKSLELKDFDSKKFNIVSCHVEKGRSLACTNNNIGSSVTNAGFCMPRNLKTGVVQGNSAYRDWWYVRYNQANLMDFDICANGISIREAQDQANQSDTDVQLVQDVDNKVAVNQFISAYNDGDEMTSGLGTWFGTEDSKSYRKISACYVTQNGKEVRYPCNRRTVLVTKIPLTQKETDSGSCYASKNGGWKVKVDTGTTLKNCSYVQLMNTKIIEPN